MGKARRVSKLQRLVRFLRRENLHRIIGVLLALSLVSAYGVYLLEPASPGVGLPDWLWWSVVTITTVGYGDITPTTAGGRLIGIVLMFIGIGILSMLTATIASFFVERNLRRERGMGAFKLENHIVLCQWNSRAQEILKELRSDERTGDTPIALIAELPTKPIDDDDLHFISGGVNEVNLRRAGVERAATVVILGDDRVEEGSRDARTVLATLAVETLNPGAYTIVELVHEENVQHCEHAKADEIIVGHQLSSRLIATSAVDHGLSRVISELLSQRYGQNLERVALPEEMRGRTFIDLLVDFKRVNKAVAVAVQRGGKVITNPDADFVVAEGDYLIAIVDRA
jgi:voltage-gated potassium channel